jgi:hypothetical protein
MIDVTGTIEFVSGSFVHNDYFSYQVIDTCRQTTRTNRNIYIEKYESTLVNRSQSICRRNTCHQLIVVH